jgi:uncharacterized membrane protein
MAISCKGGIIMEHDHEESLHKRIERLEGVVEELRQAMEEMHSVDVISDVEVPIRIQETTPVRESPDHIPATIHCPSCHKRIRKEAIKCRYCGRMIEEKTSPKVTHVEREKSSVSEILQKTSRTHEEWEALIGGQLLNRIGALALIIGIGFFLRYAIDNNWINETMRVAIGVVTGIALLYGGALFHKKGLAIFAQGLVGAGIPILYLSVYASFNYYHLVPQPIAFVLMSVVTITAIHQALRYDSSAVLLLGWLGGFLTPFLINTGEVNELGLFAYIAFLDVGLIAVLNKKTSWAIFELLTLAATYMTYFLWYGNSYEISKLPVAVVFLTIFWGLLYALDISRIIKPVTSFPQLRQWVPSLNAVFYYLAMYMMIDKEYHAWMAPVTLLIGGVYFLTFQWSQHRHGLNEVTSNRYVLTAITLLIIATSIQLSGFLLAAAWSVEGLVLVWFSSSKKQPYVWKAAIALFVLSTIRLCFSQFPEGITVYEPDEGIRFLFNSRALAFTSLAVSLAISVLPLRRIKEDIIPIVQQILHYWWSVVLLMLCTIETYDLFYDQTLFIVILMIMLSWTIYSLAMTWPALKMKVEPVLFCSLISLLLVSMFASVQLGNTFDPIEQFKLLLNIRVGVMAFLIAGIYIQTRWYKILWPDYQWGKDIGNYLHIALVFLVFVLITGETKDFFENSIISAEQSGITNEQGVVTRLGNLKQLSLSGIWLIYSMLLMGAGMWRRIQGLRIIAIALFGFTILKIFIYDLSFLDSLYRIISFIGLGVILLGVSYLYQRYKGVIFDNAVT